MKRTGRPRRDLLVALCPRGPHPIIDVGADHGHVARRLNCIATERMPNRMGKAHHKWVISDGLTAFREVGVAIIAGMGARTIAGILDRGPRPSHLVLHAQDDPNLLRHYLAKHNWRITAEALAPEAGAFAQVIVATQGQENHSGLLLEYGPLLLR